MDTATDRRILPLLRHVSAFRPGSHLAKDPWSQPLSPSLHVVLGLRNPEFTSSSARTLKSRFSILSIDEVTALSERVGSPLEFTLGNLRRQIQRSPLVQSRAGVIAFRKPLIAQASALLLPEWTTAMERILGNPFLAAVPSQDRILLFPDSPDMFEEAVSLARAAFEESPEPISSGLFRVDRGALTAVQGGAAPRGRESVQS